MEVALSVDVLLLLWLLAILAGFIDTLAGGGGLIVLPALILAGLPPHAALATNKLQGSFGTLTATLLLLKKKLIRFSNIKWLMLAAFSGSALGTIAVNWVDAESLAAVIPFALGLIALYFLLLPSRHFEGGNSKLSVSTYRRTIVPAIGAYDGMLGPGTGSFYSLSAVMLLGQDLRQATMMAKALNFMTNLASLIVFVVAGKIVWLVGGIMLSGQVIGAWIGTHSLVKIPIRVLRAMVVLVCLLMLLRYWMNA